MGCCSSPARSLVIEAAVLRVEDETCERCNGTIEAVRAAARDLQGMLLPLNVRVTLVEHAVSADEIERSNTVFINGRPVEEWLGAERIATDCPSCSDLVGASVCCGAVSVNGRTQESYTTEQIRDAAFAALGVVDVGGCC